MDTCGLYVEISQKAVRFIDVIMKVAYKARLEWIGDGSGMGSWDVSFNGSEAACLRVAKELSRLKIPGLVIRVYRIQYNPFRMTDIFKFRHNRAQAPRRMRRGKR